jgi:hypothetical protein
MFWGFLVTFGGYLCIVARPWRCVPFLRRINIALHLPSSSVRGIFLGRFRLQDGDEILRIVNQRLHDTNDLRLSLHHANDPALGDRNIYALIELGDDGEETIGEIGPILAHVKNCLAMWPGMQVRHLMRRSVENDRRAVNRRTKARSNKTRPERQERRSSTAAIAITSAASRLIIGEPDANRV